MTDFDYQLYKQWQQQTYDRLIPVLIEEKWLSSADRLFRAGIDDDALMDAEPDADWKQLELCDSGEFLVHGFGAYPLSFTPRIFPNLLQSWDNFYENHWENFDGNS